MGHMGNIDEESNYSGEGDGSDHCYEQYDAWHKCAKLLYKRDVERIKAWEDEVDGFMNFASLFSAVVTFFLTFTYADLQPDTGGQTVQLLLYISRQLGNATIDASDSLLAAHASEVGPLPAFQPTFSSIVLNSFLFGALICSVIASGKGLWIKQWLREFRLDLPRRPRELARVRQLRHLGLHAWHMRAIISAISFFLQLAVALFANALVLIVWPVDPVLRWIVFVVAMLWISVTLVAAACPALSPNCPYKSPLARTFLRIGHAVSQLVRGRGNARAFESFEKRERRVAARLGSHLDLDALVYLNEQYWGNHKLDRVNECFKDIMEKQDALKCIEQILVTRLGLQSDELGSLGRMRQAHPERDGSVLHLMGIWCEIYTKGGVYGAEGVYLVLRQILYEHERAHRRKQVPKWRPCVMRVRERRRLTV